MPWTAEPGADVSLSDTLGGISCVTPSDCMAVGTQVAGTYDETQIEQSVPGTWNVLSGVDPYAHGNRLQGV